MAFGRKKLTALTASIFMLATGLCLTQAAPAQAEVVPVSSLQPSSLEITLKTNYAVPAGALFVSPTGSDANAGTQAAPFKTVNFAITKVKSGGTLVVRGGVYREGAAGYSTGGTKYVIQPTNITIQAYPGETPWLDGTEVVSTWTKASATDYKVAWSTPDYCAGSFYTRNFASQAATGPCSYSDAIGGNASLGDPQMVFVNGTELKEVASAAQLTADTFYYDWSAREIHLGSNPAGKNVEVTRYPQALALFKASNVTIKGIGIRRYASNQYDNATGAALLLNAGAKVTLERVAITGNAGGGLLSWNTNQLTVRSSWLSGNGANGMNFAGSAQKVAAAPSTRDDLVVEYSRLDRNNADSYSVNCSFACTSAGFKGSGVVGATMRYNTFNYNDGRRGSGVWFDLDSREAMIYGNKVVGNARNGIVYEVSNKGVIASNLVQDNGWNSAVAGGYGIMMGSANTQVINNTIANNRQSIHLYDDSRSPAAGSGYNANRVGPNSVNVSLVNNIITTTQWGTYVLVVTGGNSSVAGNTSADQVISTMDYNSYAIPTANVRLVTWRAHEGQASSVYQTLSALQSAKAKEAHSDLTSASTLSAASLPKGAPLPADVAKLLGRPSGAVLPRGLITLGA